MSPSPVSQPRCLTPPLVPQDLRGTAQRLSTFLGCPLGPETLEALEQHCSFSVMRDNAMTNYTLIPREIMDHSQGKFMRKGEGARGVPGASVPASPRAPVPPGPSHPAGVVGDWRDHFSPLQNALFDRVYQEEMPDIDLSVHWAMV